MKIKFKNDKYKKTRGGYSKLLDISCQYCSTHLFNYQKDGVGSLKRMYLDRIYEPGKISLKGNLDCPKCGKTLAIPMIYKKENRLAIRILGGTIKKKILKTN